MACQVVPREGRLDRTPSNPRNKTNFNWRDFINSSWKDTDYKRRAIASLVQAVYLLELDRQENRTKEDSLAPNFWTPFKYKPTQILIDERDGSIFGAVFEFDRVADFKLFKPFGAPKAVLALRGTLIKLPTMQRDFEDDFRLVTRESLIGSARFRVTLDAVKSVCDAYGSRNVCIAGHSLGAGFGLQVGKELAKERINLEAHLFNPPSVSLAMSFGDIGEKSEYFWDRVKSMLRSGSEAQVSDDEDKTNRTRLKRLIPRLSSLMDTGFGNSQWVPHLYVNCNDWISFFYIHTGGPREKIANMENKDPTNEKNAGAAKFFVVSTEDQPFLEAHGLKQWWSSDAELKQNVHDSKLINIQLRSLNTCTASQVVLFYYPQYVSLAMTSLRSFREAADCVWNRLKTVPHLSGKAQISNDGDMIPWEVTKTSNPSLISLVACLSNIEERGKFMWKWNSLKSMVLSSSDAQISNNDDKTSGEPLKSWMPPLSGFRWVPHMYSKNSDYISNQVRSLYSITSSQVSQLCNLPSVSPVRGLGNIGEKVNVVWNRLKNLCIFDPSSNEAHVSNDAVIPLFSGLKDTGFGVSKLTAYLYVNKSGGTGEKMVDKENKGPLH